MGDLLGEDVALVQKDKLYRCLDRLLPHKRDFFSYLKERWHTLFNVSFDILLYDLTSTYFESDPPEQEGLRRFGYSRDKRSDCVQVVIALIVTPAGFPLAYEVMPGNTSDKTTLADCLSKIEAQYGKSERVWVTAVAAAQRFTAANTHPRSTAHQVGRRQAGCRESVFSRHY